MSPTHSQPTISEGIEDLLIPIQNVACVQPFHNLEHALLVLVKSGYSAVPVLDAKNRFQGVISKTLILDHILGNQQIEFDQLRDRTVADAMEAGVPVLRPDATFLQALEQSINRPFLCIVDEDQTMIGIVTRRSILVSMYQYIRQTAKSKTAGQ